MLDDSLFAFAGLWGRWKDPSGTVIESCTILTSTPSSLLADVHDLSPACTKSARCRRGRSPVIKTLHGHLAHLAFCWTIHLSVRASSISSGSDPPSRISS